jgi:50S ribosomal protein L16 3-hydroxylase
VTPPAPQLARFDIAEFLREYWQKKPLLIRNAWTDWSNPLAPDELAGLACQDLVESRLVTRSDEGWAVEHGPLEETRFEQIGPDSWTLLVQAADHRAPPVAALLQPFRFIPNWRVDDVMVSYAVDGGGVGPHFDNYDVFLVQGLGKRRWEIGEQCEETAELLPHEDLRLLADFRHTEQWVLLPGDILYLPPRVAHHGVAIGDDCMTYSIGFRAPSRAELIESWAEDQVAGLVDSDRYADADLREQENPGEISSQALSRLQDMIAEKLLDRAAFARWFGEYSTAPKDANVEWSPEEHSTDGYIRKSLAAGRPLIRNPASRFSFVRGEASSVAMFVDGRCFSCTGGQAKFAEQICGLPRLIVGPELESVAFDLVAALIRMGSVAFDPDC